MEKRINPLKVDEPVLENKKPVSEKKTEPVNVAAEKPIIEETKPKAEVVPVKEEKGTSFFEKIKIFFTKVGNAIACFFKTLGKKIKNLFKKKEN